MTSKCTDDDLERLLRATLDSRAGTVTTGPHWTGGAEVRTERRWLAPLVAAALVLALVAVFLGLRLNRSDTPPAAPTPANGPDLTTFAVPGYREAGMVWARDYRGVAVRTPGGVTSRDKADVIVFDLGTHRYSYRGFHSQGRITIDGHPGFRGTAPALPNTEGRDVATIVWNYTPWHWAVLQTVQGQRAPATATLMKVARAARLSSHLTVPTEFRFSALPAGYQFALAQVFVSTQTTVVQFRDARGARLTATSTPRDSSVAKGIASGSSVVQHGDLVLVVDASNRRGPATHSEQAAAGFLREHLEWQPSTLDHVVP